MHFSLASVALVRDVLSAFRASNATEPVFRRRVGTEDAVKTAAQDSERLEIRLAILCIRRDGLATTTATTTTTTTVPLLHSFASSFELLHEVSSLFLLRALSRMLF